MPLTARSLISLIFVWLLLCAGYLFWWHSIDTRPAEWDPTVHLGLAIDYRDFLFHHAPLTNSRTSMYPPLYHLSLVPSLLAGAPTQGKAVATHLVYMLILVLSLVGLARQMNQPPWIGMAASVLCCCYSLIQFTFCHALTDFPLIVWVTFGMYTLYRTEDFTRLRSSLLWGIVSGAGLLIKQPYPFFFIIPCAWMIFRSRQDQASRGKRLSHFLGALIIIIAIAMPWYWWESIFGLQNGLGQAFERGSALNEPDFRSLDGWLWYLKDLPTQLGWPAIIATAPGLLLLPFTSFNKRSFIFLSLWIISGYSGLTLLHAKDPRYDLPIFSAVALLSAMGWMNLSRSILYLVGICVGIMGLCIWTALTVDRPFREDWKHHDIGVVLQSHRDSSQPFLIASIESNHPRFFGRGLRWSLRRDGIQLYTQPPGDPMADFTEYVITKSGDIGPDSSDLQREWSQLKASGRRFDLLYPSVAQFQLPDGSVATIYERDSHYRFKVGPVSPSILEMRLTHSLRTLITGPLHMKIQGINDELPLGRIQDAEIDSENITIKDIPVAKANFRLHRVWLNLYTLWDEDKPGVLSFESIQPDIEIRASDIEKFVSSRVRGLEHFGLRFQDNRIDAVGQWHQLRIFVEVTIAVDHHSETLTASLSHARLNGWPIPTWILGRAHSFDVPLYVTPSLPGRIIIHQVTMDQDVLRIS